MIISRRLGPIIRYIEESFSRQVESVALTWRGPLLVFPLKCREISLS